MRVVFRSFTVVAMAWGIAGCENQAPKAAVAPPSSAPAKSPTAPVAAPAKSTIPAGQLAQVVLEVPGMT
jgi:hypothetical protein